MGVCNCSMFCCTLLYVRSSIAIILMGKRELIALLNLSSWCLMMVEPLFLPVPQGCLQFVIVVFPDHTHLLFWKLTFYFTPGGCICLANVSNNFSNSNNRQVTFKNAAVLLSLMQQVGEYLVALKAFDYSCYF